MLTYPNIDPVVINIAGPLAVRWYSFAYIAGFFVCIFFAKRQNKKLKFASDEVCDKFFSYSMIGLLVGARLFDCFFYHFSYNIHNPLNIFKVWNGGMSFHGGLLGLLVANVLFSKWFKINALKLLDLCVVVLPFALGFGRIANFINGELYGNITYTSPFAMIFPTDPAQQPRHPSQLYEAFTEGIIMLAVMMVCYYKTKAVKFTGMLTGIFGLYYSIARFVCEFFRSPEIPFKILGHETITAGQFISVLMFLTAIVWMIWCYKIGKRKPMNGR